MRDPNYKFHSTEIWTDESRPITGVIMNDKTLFHLEPECGWKVTKLFTDYTLEHNSHKCLIVVLEPEEG